MIASHFDLIVIGAGINGAGIARDAAMRGLSVLVLDKGDIGSGTSSYSTRLIHGGLRYLEHGEFGLVRESLRERETLLRIAPHLVKPIPILIPIYKGASRGRLTIRAGMFAYDLLSMGKSVPSHQMFSREETLRKNPGLESKDLIGAAVYYDCQVEFAERLVLENILSAREHGAEILTYSQVNRVAEQRVAFILHGQQETVSAGVVVNAAGPWVDDILRDTESPVERLIGGTKGSHIVVKRFPGAPSQAVYVEAESDRRPFFVIPWNGNYLIGTTDDRFAGDLDQVRSELWEVDYLLKETNRVFPQAELRRADVCYTYAGVRPLPFTTGSEEQSITRRHFIREDPTNKHLLSIVGGKLTTYRSLAEECVDLVFKKLGRHSPRCRTQETSLPGAFRFNEELHWPVIFSEKVRQRLRRVYGSQTRELVDLCNAQPGLAETFNKERDALAGEIVFSFESELATSLTDCLMRRTMIGLNADLGMGDIEAAAEICKRYLGWTDDRVRTEIECYKQHVDLMLVNSSVEL
jgi:glycerol-3-phosphate dehydrogenase